MKKNILIILPVFIAAAILTSCEPQAKEGSTTAAQQKDTVTNQSIRPTDTGYAAVNGPENVL
jgi:hypothetical protein